MSFSAAVLAGGRSTRMGTDKAFLRIGDEPLLERQLRVLRECGAAEVLISGRAGVDYSAFAGVVAHDNNPEAGPLAGLASVLKAASRDLVLVLAVDMPEMTAAILRKVLSSCEAGIGCVPFDAEGFQPLAAAYPRAVLPMAEESLLDGKFSMREFVTTLIAKGLLRPLRLEASERVFFTNWNQPGDWNQAQES